MALSRSPSLLLRSRARGALLRSSLAEPLHDGDAFLFTDEPVHELTAGVPSELLVWSFG